MELRDYLHILRKNWLIILALTLVGVGAAVAHIRHIRIWRQQVGDLLASGARPIQWIKDQHYIFVTSIIRK